jgi:diguanylate cyclase (GGDEF)-like protein/PAS domain S-box-containing protein
LSHLRRINSMIVILALALLLSSLEVHADAGEERIVYLSATEYDYPPFSVTNRGEADGFSVELLKAVAEEMGMAVSFKIDAWSVIKEELKEGELDVLPLVGYTEERDAFFDFTVPYIVMRGNIFVRTDDNRIQSQDDLFGKDILVLDGDNSQEWAWSIGLDSELTATKTYLEAFELLARGQYDAVLAQGLVGEILISDHKLDQLTPVYVYDDRGVNRYKLSLEGYEQKFCFAVTEGDSELLSRLNEGLSMIAVNGVYDELYQKWFPFLIEDEGVSTLDIVRYVLYALLPIMALLIGAYFITTRRTIRVRTHEIIKEKERSEKYLHDLILSGRIFESSIKNAPIPIMIHAEDGMVLNISRTWTQLTGYRQEDIPSIYDWTEKAYGSNKDDVRHFIAQLYQLKETQYDGNFPVLTQDGRTLIWDFHSMHIGDLPDGRAVAMSVATDITEITKQEEEKAKLEQQWGKLIKEMPLGFCLRELIFNENGEPVDYRFLSVNDNFEEITGLKREEIIGKTAREIMPNIESTWIEQYAEVVMKKKTSILEDYSGSLGKYFRVVAYPHRDNEFVVIADDITERKINQKLLVESEKNYRLLTSQMPLGLAVHEIICDEQGEPIDFKFISINDSWESVMGIKKDIVLGKRIMDVFPDTEKYWIESFGKVAITGKPSEITSYSRELKRHLSCVVYSPRPGVFAVIVEDITMKRKNEEEKEYLRTHDPLTKLSNRVYFEQQMQVLDKEEHDSISMINFDINGLILINEAFGHESGDELIIFVAETLNKVFDEHSVVSRVGGDQFTVISINTTKEEALSKAREVADMVKAYDVHGIQLSISYGIATRVGDEDINTLFLTSENNMYSNKIFESQSYRNNSIKFMIKAYHEKNPREEDHSHRVSKLCEKFGMALGMGDDDINKLKAISHLHDIGKIAIDEAILNKPGKLTADEWETIKKHPEIGARIISTSDEYVVIADDILSHHERFDGQGYPFGISGTKIPIRARIIAIIDAFDAMTSDRPYRKAMPQKEAVEELKRCAGTQFDPELVRVFIREVLQFKE